MQGRVGVGGRVALARREHKAWALVGLWVGYQERAEPEARHRTSGRALIPLLTPSSPVARTRAPRAPGVHCGLCYHSYVQSTP